MGWMDCRLVQGHWLAIILSLLLFNIGIALAAFAASFGSQGWRIVGVAILGVGFLMLIAIPILMRRNIRSRLHEAFRSLPGFDKGIPVFSLPPLEAEMRRKRCSGHYIAWVLSAIHFILGIAITSYANDIQSEGWAIVGLVLIVIGFLLMVLTTVIIYLNLRERKPKILGKKEDKNKLLSNDPSKVALVEMNGERREGPEATDQVITIADIHDEQIDELSKMLDNAEPNWNTFGVKIATTYKHRIKDYNHFISQLDTCRASYHFEETPAYKLFTYLQAKQPKVDVRSFLDDAELNGRKDIVDYINTWDTLIADNGDDIYLNEINDLHKKTLVNMMEKYVEEEWPTIAASFDIMYDDVNDIQVDVQQTPHISPTLTLFVLLKSELSSLTLNEIYNSLNGIGRADVTSYLVKSFSQS